VCLCVLVCVCHRVCGTVCGQVLSQADMCGCSVCAMCVLQRPSGIGAYSAASIPCTYVARNSKSLRGEGGGVCARFLGLLRPTTGSFEIE